MRKKILITLSILTLFVCVGGYVFISHNSNKKEVIKITTTNAVAYRSKKDLVDTADIIIKGTTKGTSQIKLKNPNYKKGKDAPSIIMNDVTVSVDEVYKGTPYNSKSIKIRTSIEKYTLSDDKNVYEVGISPADPEFTIGEENILFLAKDDSDLADPNESYYILIGYGQGKFSQAKTEGINGGNTFTNGSEKIDYSNLKNELKQIEDDLKKNPIVKPNPEEVRKNNEELFGK